MTTPQYRDLEPGLLAELEKVKAERDEAKQRLERMHGDALGYLAKYVATPEEGYIAAPHCLPSDIQRLGNERDDLKRQLAEANALAAKNCKQAVKYLKGLTASERELVEVRKNQATTECKALRLRVETLEKAYSAEKLAEIFIAWPLPDSVNSDPCVTIGGSGHRRTGTNLLTVMEARKMFEYILARAALDKKKEDSNL